MQQEHGNRFLEAISFARMAIRDPELNAFYAKKAEKKDGLGAWHMAIRDYMNPPRIYWASFINFKGKRNDEIIVDAYDLFRVEEVAVSFMLPDGCPAGELQVEHEEWTDWKFRLVSDITCTPGMTVTIRATDLPGNSVTEILTWPFDTRERIEFMPVEGLLSKGKRKKSQLRLK